MTNTLISFCFNQLTYTFVCRVATTSNSLASVTNITRELRDLNTSGLIHNFQSFLKEGESVRFSRNELYRICWYGDNLCFLCFICRYKPQQSMK